ncbi:hypothetical protein GSI_04745 [Ganoderma sinense ZZ0214-1]|uniref:BTB domain-containing protein n=1 Tax=Ganoderma sinense ZZ0214-1 TaxID=1077348 RepID=A0A2G8SHP7_9APHY|nr:hypothetical protein GSI_04745 [Ganoderma sinense ZZ0214-1]
MTSDPSRKRPRLELEGPELSRKDEEVWLSDGNIVVIAAGEVAFRVHKSILSLRSEVFCGLFSLPDADQGAAETMDGAPIVHVSDSPDDIRRLFLVICCGKNYYYNAGALVPVPFAVLASLIRMAHKYAIQDVLDDALFRLKKYYTDNFREWKDPDSRACYVTTTEADAPTVIELARLTNTPWLIPSAFLACTQLATRSALKYEDNSFAPASSMFASLSTPDQVLLVQAMARLARVSSARLLHLMGAVPCKGCTARDRCTLARDAPALVTYNYGDMLIPPPCGKDAMEPVAEELWNALWKTFCDSCREVLVETEEEIRMTMWNTLPEFFNVDVDLDDWDSRSTRIDGP